MEDNTILHVFSMAKHDEPVKRKRGYPKLQTAIAHEVVSKALGTNIISFMSSHSWQSCTISCHPNEQSGSGGGDGGGGGEVGRGGGLRGGGGRLSWYTGAPLLQDTTLQSWYKIQ